MADIVQIVRDLIAARTAMRWDVLNVTAAGDVLFAERLDRTGTAKGDVGLPCVGLFVMENGGIKEWRDYFDLGAYMKAIQG